MTQAALIWLLPPIKLEKTELKVKHCGICGENHLEDNCDYIKVTNIIADRKVESRARLTLPDFMEVRKLADGTSNIYTKQFIPQGTQFGPFLAKKIFTLSPNINFPLKIFSQDVEEEGFSEYYLDSTNEEETNWMMFVNPASTAEEQNLICYQTKGSIYYLAVKDIPEGSFLYVWYSPYYASKMNKTVLKESQNSTQDNIDINNLVKQQKNIMLRDSWNCKFCGKIEHQITIFASHLLEHYRNQMKRICDICKAAFTSTKSLKKHKTTVHWIDKKKNQSESTSIILKTNNNQKQHSSLGGPLLNDTIGDSVDNSVLLQSDIQNFDINNIENQNILLENDNLSMDNLFNENVKNLDHFNFELKESEEQFVCDICLKSFNKLKYLVQHLQMHTGTYICFQCKKVFCRKENLKNHGCNSVTSFSCSSCEKTFPLKKYLRKHELQHRKQFSCMKCKINFSCHSELSEHKCLTIPLKQKFNCSVCSKPFFKEKYLRRHMDRHTRKMKQSQEEEMICHICSKVLKTKDALKTHMKTHLEPFVSCDLCDKKFRRTDIRDSHRLTHFDNLVECPVCNKQFKSKKVLIMHEKTHQIGPKPFKCNKCDSSFRQKPNLLKHLRMKHMERVKEEKPVLECFICPKCDKKIKLRSSLLRHIKRIHPEFYSESLKNETQRGKYKINIKTKLKEENLDQEDSNMLDLKQTIENMDFATDVASGCAEEAINLEFESILKSTTDKIGNFLPERNDKMMDNLLEMALIEGEPKEELKNKEICLSMPDLTNGDQEIKLGKNAYMMPNGIIIEPQEDPDNVVVYTLD